MTNKTETVDIDRLAKIIEIDNAKFKTLLMGIGFAQIGNEATRQALINGHKVPTAEHYKTAINSYSKQFD